MEEWRNGGMEDGGMEWRNENGEWRMGNGEMEEWRNGGIGNGGIGEWAMDSEE